MRRYSSNNIFVSFTASPCGGPLLSHTWDGCLGHITLSELCTFAPHCICPNDFSVKPQFVVPPKGIHSENFVHHFRGVEMTEIQ